MSINDPEPGISADALTRAYGDHLAVKDVSFSVRRGEVFGLLGPNGAGKTTLLRMLAGVLSPTRGRARLLGTDVAVDPQATKRNLGFLSGDTALYGRLSALEVLDYFARLYRLSDAKRRRRTAAVIREFGLEPFANQRCESLSSGQNQRVTLARAFIADPAVLILDEPTVGLDVVSGRFVIEAIERARNAGKAVLFSTHIMSEVHALCDRVGILFDGRLHHTGTIDELLALRGVPDLGALLLALDDEAKHAI